MKNIILRFGIILAILLTGCTEPGDEIINVSKMTTTTNYEYPSEYPPGVRFVPPNTTTSKATEDITVKVRYVKWAIRDGAWQGKPIHADYSDDRIIYTPKDAKAMRAIDRFMKR
jgi:hypothetical protein